MLQQNISHLLFGNRLFENIRDPGLKSHPHKLTLHMRSDHYDFRLQIVVNLIIEKYFVHLLGQLSPVHEWHR